MPAPRRPEAHPVRAVLTGLIHSAITRHHVGRILVIAILTLAVATIVERARQRADEAAAQWEPSVAVLVATDALAAGAVIDPDTMRASPAPSGIVPFDAVTEITPNTRTRVDIAAGEILRASRLHPGDGSSAAARLPARTSALTVDGRHLPAQIGDTVQVHDLVTGSRLVADGTIVDRDEHHLTVAVPIGLMGDVVASLGSGGVIVTLVDGPSP